jgi:hypothetical protein
LIANVVGFANANATVGQCVNELALSVISTASTNPPIVHRPQNDVDVDVDETIASSVVASPLVVSVVSVVVVSPPLAGAASPPRRPGAVRAFMNGAFPRCASSVSQNVSQNASRRARAVASASSSRVVARARPEAAPRPRRASTVARARARKP